MNNPVMAQIQFLELDRFLKERRINYCKTVILQADDFEIGTRFKSCGGELADLVAGQIDFDQIFERRENTGTDPTQLVRVEKKRRDVDSLLERVVFQAHDIFGLQIASFLVNSGGRVSVTAVWVMEKL